MTTSQAALVRRSWMLLILFACVRMGTAQGLSFGTPERAADGAIELTLVGETGANLEIEASTNLLEWTVVTSGVATNGSFTHRQAIAPARAMFFRGRAASDSLPAITVVPQADTNYLASGLASMSGSTVVLNGTNFVRFTLNIPSNSVPNPAVLTLTHITNFASLPFAGPLLGAVRIEPTNAIFWRAASLEITYPTNTDRRKIVSFACEPNGTAFRLTIDRVHSNRVVIPVARGGIYGSVLATEEEIVEVGRHAVSPAPPPTARVLGWVARTRGSASLPEERLGGLVHLQTTETEECEAAEKARAEAIRARIQREMDQRSHDIATIMGVERQRQLVGVAEDGNALLATAGEAICNFYRNEVQPHWPEAANNCALAKVLLRFAFSLERQLQLLQTLGLTEDCIGIGNLPLCGMMENCLKEIRDCCDLGFKGSDKVTQVLELQRQDQLMGLACISSEEAREAIDRCATNVWNGTFSARAFGRYFFSTNDRGTLIIEIRELESTFEGAVVQSQEFGTPEAGFTIQLMVQGQLTYSDFESRSADSQESCRDGGFSSRYSLQEGKTVGSGNITYLVNIATMPDGAYFIFAGNHPTTNNVIGIPGTETNIDFSQVADCDGDSFSQNRVTQNEEVVIGPGMPLYHGQLTEPNPTGISGMSTNQETSGEFTTNYEFQWSFERRRAP